MTGTGAFRTTSSHHSDSSSAPSVSLTPLADGISGTLQTLALMRACVLGQAPPDYSGYLDRFNISAAQSICARSGQDQQAQIAALFRFTRDQIKYVDHPWNMQVVKDCKRTLESREGDCVSKSVCLATLLAAYGFVPRFVAQASNDDSGFDHVYVECWPGERPGHWWALDPTADSKDGRPLADLGWSQTLLDGGFEMPFDIF